jgi:hypothetical protein
VRWWFMTSTGRTIEITARNMHVISFAPLEPNYVSVEAFNIPNNSITVIKLVDKYLLIVSNDDGDFIETFESFKELNSYLRQNFGLELKVVV